MAAVTSIDADPLAPDNSSFLPRLSFFICTASNDSTNRDDGLLGSKQDCVLALGEGVAQGGVSSYHFIPHNGLFRGTGWEPLVVTS